MIQTAKKNKNKLENIIIDNIFKKKEKDEDTIRTKTNRLINCRYFCSRDNLTQYLAIFFCVHHSSIGNN